MNINTKKGSLAISRRLQEVKDRLKKKSGREMVETRRIKYNNERWISSFIHLKEITQKRHWI